MKRISRRLTAVSCALALALSLVLPVWAAPVFSDVGEGKWYKPYTDKAVEAGLMQGVGGDRFGPDGKLTLAQVLVLAYQLHRRYHPVAVLPNGDPWYMPYYTYCTETGILDRDQLDRESLGRNATRFELVSILDRAVPHSELAAINTLKDGFVPDVAEGDLYGAVVYRWYRAGALAGDNEHRFNGESQITRAEVAVLLCQITGLVERVTLKDTAPADGNSSSGQTEAPAPSDPGGEVLELVNAARAKEGLAPFVLDGKVTAAAQAWAEERAKGSTGDRSFANALDEAGVSSKGAAGMNAGQGYTTAAEAVADWMGTETMRGRILSEQYTTIGVGFASGAKQWVLLFIEG